MSKPTKQKKKQKAEQREVYTSPDAMATALHIKVPFIGFHCWPEAPEHLSYLRAMHRHVFNVTVSIFVKGNDRTVEFHEFAETLFNESGTIVDLSTDYQQKAWSCEEIANRLHKDIQIHWDILKMGTSQISKITVQEDDEHSATVFFRKSSQGN